MLNIVEGEAVRQEAVKDVANEVLEQINELGLNEMKFSSVRVHCSDLIKDFDKWAQTYRTLLPDYLDTGNTKAKAYAVRLRNTTEWASPAPEARANRPGDLFPEVRFKEGETPLQHATMITLDCMRILDIKVAEPFKSLLPIRSDIKERIVADMVENEFDPSQPLVIWKEENVLVDGHTRLAAAARANLSKVPVLRKSFKDEAAAVAYALHTQCGRRNLTDAELIDLIPKVDRLSPRGGDRRSDAYESRATDVALGRSSDRTAEILGINGKKVERARKVLLVADEETVAGVRAGDITINAAYNQLTQNKAKTQAALPTSAAQTPTEPSSPNSAPEPVDAGDKTESFEVDRSIGGAPDREELDGDIADPNLDEPPAEPAEYSAAKVNTDSEPESMATEQEQAADETSDRPTGRVKSAPEPDLAGILKALHAILKLTGNNADLQARFRADIQVIDEMMNLWTDGVIRTQG